MLQVAGEPVLVTREDLGTMQARLLARQLAVLSPCSVS